MRIAVCDDNAVFLQFFKSMLANELESRSVKAEIETFTKAESFFYCHGKKPFSAIFLDLDMPEMTGFEVARQLGQNGNCFVIFVTSHQELVYDSFNFRPLNFICKDPDADVMKDRLHMVAGQLTDALKQEKTVVLENMEQGRISVKLRDVTYIESNSHSIIYHFANNKDTIAVRDSIGEIEEAYRKFDFIRVHKKYIVNLKYVFNISRSNAVKKFLSISLSQVAILLITSLELNAVSSFFKISLRKLVVEQSLLRFVTLIMIQISIFIVFRLILMAFKHTDDYTASDWVTIIAVLIISFFLVMVIHELSLSADYGHRLYINLSYMLVFVLNILIFWIINSLIKKNRKLKEMEIVKLREQYLEQFIGNAESQYDAMRKLRHDIKDKYETVNELLKVQKIDETRKFISESFDLIGKSESYVKTKNNIVNAIVNAKLTMASSLGIKISCITVSDFEGIKGTDLCDLLSNTLENAITACKEIADDANKFLYLKIDRETDTYTFLIKNSIDHSVMDSNPRLTTTKADKKQHGLGTSIIREIARKYNGRCDFYESEGMFCCQVTLMADTTVLN